MFVVNNYTLAVVFCFVTMLCWGSWGNTQKLASKSWRYELFYWDYVIGMLLFSILSGFTLGSFGSEGRSFVADLAQADWGGIGSVLLGGVVFNASNILLSASVSLAGLAVAFPLGVGLALVLGVIVNYVGAPKGDPVILFLGVAQEHIKNAANKCHHGRKGLGLDQCQPETVTGDIRHADQLAGNSGTNVCTHNDTYRLRKGHDAGVYQTDTNNDRAGRGLDDTRDEGAKNNALER